MLRLTLLLFPLLFFFFCCCCFCFFVVVFFFQSCLWLCSPCLGKRKLVSLWSSCICKPVRDKTNKMTCAPSEDSDQPGHPSSLIRVFVVRMQKPWDLSYLLSARWRLWSDWADGSVGWIFHAAALVCLSCICYSLVFSPPLGVGGPLWIVIVALPGLLLWVFPITLVSHRCNHVGSKQ